ncbi:LUD domain-containing protein [Parabacteroides sp. Marseille-P3160]|uniref:LutC/YkgG family protein n=1 Tax=Parabacteroides sp. Marseille-P3160 TaxID=1917887 RepID=UPI0009BC0C77|nr:LUD domain-containing protein [Parabacteroides sp. Marseille-P3160]
MSSKDEIIAKIKRNIQTTYERPFSRIEGIRYPDKTAQFLEVSQAVGGEALFLEEGQDLNELLSRLFPEAKRIASNLPFIRIATVNPDELERPQDLDGTDLAIIQGEIGVAENGCVWIPQNVKKKAVYFIAEQLVILLDRNKIVNNMHEAYAQLPFGEAPFGVFISGPSKTADIEQALVVGAHGARGLTVILI